MFTKMPCAHFRCFIEWINIWIFLSPFSSGVWDQNIFFCIPLKPHTTHPHLPTRRNHFSITNLIRERVFRWDYSEEDTAKRLDRIRDASTGGAISTQSAVFKWLECWENLAAYDPDEHLCCLFFRGHKLFWPNIHRYIDIVTNCSVNGMLEV